MANLWSLAYISNADHPLSSEEIDRLLSDARAFNEQQHVTGVLLYDNDIFFQLLEGEEHELACVYARIKKATRHRNITEFFYKKINQRSFDQWFMGFAHVPHTVLQQLSQANWLMEMHSNPETATPSHGMRLLLEFWRAAHQIRKTS